MKYTICMFLLLLWAHTEAQRVYSYSASDSLAKEWLKKTEQLARLYRSAEFKGFSQNQKKEFKKNSSHIGVRENLSFKCDTGATYFVALSDSLVISFTWQESIKQGTFRYESLDGKHRAISLKRLTGMLEQSRKEVMQYLQQNQKEEKKRRGTSTYSKSNRQSRRQ